MVQEERWLLEEKWHGEKTEGFFADCERIKSGEPLAYIIGHVPFLDTKIYLDSHPLIPRTETEFWVEKTINTIKLRGLTPQFGVIKVLDLCAGSGCVGVAILKAIPFATVDFVEIDNSHHHTIQKNIHENNIDASRTKIIGGNLFEHVTSSYDYILTNPPYIDPVLDRTEASVKQHEPGLALYGGTQGIAIISTIIETAGSFLNDNGALIIEHEPEQYTLLQSKAREMGFCMNSHRDQFGIRRFTHFIRKKI